MKKILTIACLFAFTACQNNAGKDLPKEIIKQGRDSRGLISVVFAEGKDTFAFDYLNRAEYDSIFKPDGLIKTQYVCPDCGEWGCIYEDIDTRYDEGTDIEIETAIYEVCKERGITDLKTIDLIKANYYL